MNVADAMSRAQALADAGDHAAALEVWGPLAHAGVARAQSNIGACFAHGLGVAVDPDLAFRWLSLAAEAGDRVGQRNFATLHFEREDYLEAARWYRAASEKGDGPAQDMLSWMLLEGEVLPKNEEEARRWAEAAAAQGIASSATRLGMIHHNALGVPRDRARAAQWWRKGFEGGDADGAAMLGAACHLGHGVEKDRVEAFALLSYARKKGSALADPFLEPVRLSLSPDDLARAETRALQLERGATP